ncbi:MAG: hypothetical protein ACJ780_10850 [Solirubrobacteraceae bacterium]
MPTQRDAVRDPEGDIGPGGATADAQAKAQEAAGQAREKAQDAAGQARDKAQEAVGQARDSAQAMGGVAQGKAREQVDQRSSQLAEQIDQQASDLRSVGAALREQGKERPAQAVDRIVSYAERAGGYLREKDADAMLSDAEDLGRRRPAAVAAGAFTMAFVASRFLKASSTKRYSARAGQQTSPHEIQAYSEPGAEAQLYSPAHPQPSTAQSETPLVTDPGQPWTDSGLSTGSGR